MDIATVAGIGMGFLLIAVSILIGGSPAAFFNVPSLLIVVGGTVATTLIRFPMPMVLGTTKVIKNAFFEKSEPIEQMIRKIVELSELARRESVLALDNVEIEDEFLRKGVQLAVDGTDPALIRQILNTELIAILDRHKLGNKIFRGMGDSAPAFGMIGTLIGLVQMLMAMDDPKSIGPAMAVALLTTMYGAIIANVVCIPIADKLAYRTQNEKLLKQVCIQGIDGIMAGTHPRVIEEKLLTFLSPASREQARKAA